MGMIEELTALGKEIETAKHDVANLQGRKDSELERLQAEFNVKDVAQAEQLLAKYEDEVQKLDADIQQGFTELKEKFTW